ncbi:MAG: TnpV protein, partial [Clostridia bacterium]|nr:TnpV protein [Clostridia bacterium]
MPTRIFRSFACGRSRERCGAVKRKKRITPAPLTKLRKLRIIKPKNNPNKEEKNMELTYRIENGMRIPDLTLPPQPKGEIGKYGRMRLEFLKAH